MLKEAQAMRYLLLTLLILLLAGCSGGSNPAIVDIYEGLWLGEGVSGPAELDLWLDIRHVEDAHFDYTLYAYNPYTVMLAGAFVGVPDGTLALSYSDGIRVITFTGQVDGDVLEGMFTSTGLVPSVYTVVMER